MIHSLISVIYEAAFKQCSNIQLSTDIKAKSEDNKSAVAIGITPESSSIMWREQTESLFMWYLLL